MKKLLCVMISIMVLLSNLTIYVQAEEAVSDIVSSNNAPSDMEDLIDKMHGDADNSELDVDIVWQNGKTKKVIYSGKLGEYLFGIYKHIDFTDIEYQIIFSTLGVTDDVIYIVPKGEKPIEDVMDELTPDGDGKFSNSAVAGGSTIKCDVNLMYDGKYHERIIIKDKQLTVPIKITNTGSDANDITCFIGEYDAAGKLINEVDLTPVRVGANTSVAATLIRNFDEAAKSTKIFIWEDGTLRPITNAISLTEAEADYYSNNFANAQEYNIAYPIEGNINTNSDIDYIKFVPENTGSYTFNCISAVNVMSSLYNSNQSVLKTGSSSFRYDLSAGQVYYLKMYGNTAGEYVVSVQYNTSSEADSFDVYQFDVDTNIYKKSIKETCDDLYYSNKTLSKQMYDEYESILGDDAKLHRLPEFLSGHPKNLSNFDTLLNQYYGTRYSEFVAIKQRYIDLIDKYAEFENSASTSAVELDTDMIAEAADESKVSNDGENELYPIIGKYTPSAKQRENIETGSIGTGNIGGSDEIQATAVTPSFTIVSTTATSITYRATFPVSGQWGNIIRIIDFNTNDGLTVEKNQYDTDEYRPSGQYTISGLKPGGIYVLGMWWSTDGEWSGGDNSIYRYVQLPNNTTENLSLYTGGRVTARLEASDKALASSSDFNTWLSRMDKVYNSYKDLTGYTPFNSKKIEMKSTRDNLNTLFDIEDGQNYYWVVYGYFDGTNTFKYGNAYYKGLLRRLSKGDWGWLSMHEMSHVFDNYKWNFDAETLAQFKSYYVMEQLNAKVYDCNENENILWYTGSEYYDYLKDNRFMQSYNNSFGNGSYASEGFAAILIDIQKEIGWTPFKKTFRYFSGLSYRELPDTDGETLKLFLTKLKDYSGEDVLGYIKSRDKNIIESHFAINLEYVEPVYPSVPSGGGGGSHSEVNVDKGNYAVYQFTPTASDNYYIYTSPYAGSGVSNDTYIEVYANANLSGTPIASNDDYDGGRFSKVSIAATSGTTYYIKVRHYASGQLHAELNITKDAPIQPLTLDNHQNIITSNGEFALFSFTPNTTGAYVFEVENYNGGTTEYDTYIKLYDSISMTNRLGNDEKKIVANLKAGQTYYLQFSGYLMKYARGRINVSQGQILQFTKRNDSSFIYVNSPEYITRFDMVDNNEYHNIMELTPKAKIAEFENVTGKNTLYETHTAWWGALVDGKSYDPLQQFYMDIDFYNPTSNTITVSVENLAYGTSYSDLQQYYNGGYSFDFTIEPYSHIPIFSHIGAPLLCREKEAGEWARIPVILFDFTVQGGNVTVSSLAAYNPQNLYLRSNTKNIVDATGAELNCGEILFGTDDNNNVIWGSGKDPRQNETDLYGKMKGIARNESAWIDSEIELVIDDSTMPGETIPINLKDDYYTYGILNPKWSWKSSINPLNDAWDGVLIMLPSGLHNFRYPYGNTGREWYFDFNYRDLRKIDLSSSRISVNDPVPSNIIDYAKRDMASGQKNHFGEEEPPDEYSMSIGEWGATYHYTVTVKNTTNSDRTANIKMWSAENMIFGLKKQGEMNYTTTYYAKIYNTPSNPENTATVSVPANDETTFEFVTMLGGGLGGLNHSIVIE